MSRNTALQLCSLPAGELFQQAGRLAWDASGNDINLCAIINIKSGHCSMDCKFCIQSAHNRSFKGYPLLSANDLKNRIEILAATPVNHIGLVSSGIALSGADFDRLLLIIEDLPISLRPRLCVSLGQLNQSQLKSLRAVGITRYHHNLETSSSFYPELCSTQTWNSRQATLTRAKEAGLNVCSGGIFGAGESWEDRIDLALSLAELHVNYVPLNFLHPQPGTPYADKYVITTDEALRIIAIFRHLLPKARLRICGGRPITFGKRQKEIFAAGANALMTGDYLTTEGFELAEDLGLIALAGMKPEANR